MWGPAEANTEIPGRGVGLWVLVCRPGPRVGLQHPTLFRLEERVMNHTQGYFQTLTATVGPVPIPTLGVAVPTYHLSYCFLNFPFTFIFL